MLNPSVADATRDDPTLRRCLSFARAWGFGGLRLVNLFAGRATKPRELFTKFDDPIGPENDAVLQSGSLFQDVILGWGANGSTLGRAADVLTLLASIGVKPKCLGLTKHGQPKHVLYLPADARPVRFRLAR